jgi:hypothetical protein
VSTKAEQEEGRAPGPVERAAEREPVEKPLNGAAHANGDGRFEEAETKDRAADGRHSVSADLSAADADRFAARFRPSWEAAAPGPVSARPSAPHSVPASIPSSAAWDQETDLDVSEFPGAKQRRRALMLAAAAVVSFVVLVALGFLSTRTTAPLVTTPHTDLREQQRSEPSPQTPPPQAMPAPAPVEPAPPPPPTVVPVAPPTAAAEPAPAPPSEPSVQARVEKPARGPVLVHVRVTTSPDDAQLSLDGSPVPNPFDTSMPQGGKHRVVAHADGYHSDTLTLSFDRDQTVAIRLDKLKPTKPRRAPTPTSKPAVVATHTRRPVPPPRRIAAPAPSTSRGPTTKGAGFVTESPY